MPKITINSESIRAELIRQARELYPTSVLRGIDKVPAKSIQKHNRHRTPYISSEIIGESRPGACGYCPAANGLRARGPNGLPLLGIYGALVMLHITHTLEKDDNGDWAVYDYVTPGAFQRRQLRYDKTGKMRENTTTFRPLPISWRREAMKISKANSSARRPEDRRVHRRFQRPRKLRRAATLEDFMNKKAA